MSQPPVTRKCYRLIIGLHMKTHTIRVDYFDHWRDHPTCRDLRAVHSSLDMCASFTERAYRYQAKNETVWVCATTQAGLWRGFPEKSSHFNIFLKSVARECISRTILRVRICWRSAGVFGILTLLTYMACLQHLVIVYDRSKFSSSTPYPATSSLNYGRWRTSPERRFRTKA